MYQSLVLRPFCATSSVSSSSRSSALSRDGDELELAPDLPLVGVSRHPDIAAVGLHDPGLDVVGQIGRQYLVDDPRLETLLLDRIENLGAALEVPRHPVGAPRVDLGLSAVMEVIDPRVLEVAIENAGDSDVLADPRDARTQAANSPHEQIDPHASPGGFVELADRLRIDERVHLRDDAPRFLLGRLFDLPLDQLA
jgi:hypothetical protein